MNMHQELQSIANQITARKINKKHPPEYPEKTVNKNNMESAIDRLKYLKSLPEATQIIDFNVERIDDHAVFHQVKSNNNKISIIQDEIRSLERHISGVVEEVKPVKETNWVQHLNPELPYNDIDCHRLMNGTALGSPEWQALNQQRQVICFRDRKTPYRKVDS